MCVCIHAVHTVGMYDICIYIYTCTSSTESHFLHSEVFFQRLRCLITGDPTPEEDQKVLFDGVNFHFFGEVGSTVFVTNFGEDALDSI